MCCCCSYVLNNKSEDYYRNFKQSIKSKETFITYDHRLKAFMKYKQFNDFAQLIEDKSIKEIEGDIIDFIIYLKEKGYSLGSQKASINALNHFYGINDVLIRRQKLAKFFSNDDSDSSNNSNTMLSSSQEEEKGGRGGREQQENNANARGDNDRPYDRTELAKLLQYADLRSKVMIYIMASAGLRSGALPLLKYGDLIEVSKYNLYQVRVYANSKSNRHHSFCTPEAKAAIDNYLNYRRQAGEHITPKSPLFRREFNRSDIFDAANNVKPITKFSVKKAIQQLLYISGLRTPLVNNHNNHNHNRVFYVRRKTATNHGFRKFFDVSCTYSGMNPVFIGHKLKGVKDSYFNPQPDSNGVYLDILEGHYKSPGFLDAIPYLTIDNSQRLQRENEMLKVQKSEFEYLKEQVEEYKVFRSELNMMTQEMKQEMDQLKELFRKQNRI
jgi:integrase